MVYSLDTVLPAAFAAFRENGGYFLHWMIESGLAPSHVAQRNIDLMMEYIEGNKHAIQDDYDAAEEVKGYLAISLLAGNLPRSLSIKYCQMFNANKFETTGNLENWQGLMAYFPDWINTCRRSDTL